MNHNIITLIDNLNHQIVRSRDTICELENHNHSLVNENEELRTEIQSLRTEIHNMKISPLMQIVVDPPVINSTLAEDLIALRTPKVDTEEFDDLLDEIDLDQPHDLRDEVDDLEYPDGGPE